MASKLSTSPPTIFLLLMLFFLPSLGDLLSTTNIEPDSICNSTPYPPTCKSYLSNVNPGTIHDYGRISLERSLSTAQQFLSLIERYLIQYPSVLALQDCLFLAQLNVESLSKILDIVKFVSTTLDIVQADELHSLLSATLTNQQTCLEGLQLSAWKAKNGLFRPIYIASMHYSVTLALFKQGWVPKMYGKEGRLLSERKHFFPNGAMRGLPLRMSGRDRKMSESTSGGKLQDYGLNLDKALVSELVVVNPDGTGNFTTITDAVNAAPNDTADSGYKHKYFAIYVMAGVYYEYVSIPKNKHYLMMIGDGINKTVITGNRSVADGWTTFNSATLIVVGRGFVAVNITFQNTAGAIKHQAVAVRNGADLSTFYRCSFEGYQDTLYTHSLRQFYRECDIYGTVDYIFGNAAVVIQKCNIYSRLPLPGQYNTITAQSRSDINQNTGTSIQNSYIKADTSLASSNGTTKTYLGRPWKQYSRTVFMQSYLGNLIDPAGWYPWSGDFALRTLYYAEFNNTGPGSNTNNRVTWPGYHVINAADAVNFTVSNLIVGDYWLPTTRVPFTAGLY